MAANSYDHYVGAGVMLPDCKGEKLMGKPRKQIKYYDIITGGVHYNSMHNNSVYEFEYTGGTT